MAGEAEPSIPSPELRNAVLECLSAGDAPLAIYQIEGPSLNPTDIASALFYLISTGEVVRTMEPYRQGISRKIVGHTAVFKASEIS